MTRLQKILFGVVIAIALTTQFIALSYVLSACQIDGWISFQRHLAIYPVGLLVFNGPILVLMAIVRHEDKKDAARKRAASKNKRRAK